MKHWIGQFIHFSAAHFYAQSNWSSQKNREIFGACYSTYGHGHNYTLLIETNPEVGRMELRHCANQIRQTLDHHHLNFDLAEFKTKVPTTENIALWVEDFLKANLKNLTQLQITLNESPELGAKITHHSNADHS